MDQVEEQFEQELLEYRGFEEICVVWVHFHDYFEFVLDFELDDSEKG